MAPGERRARGLTSRPFPRSPSNAGGAPGDRGKSWVSEKRLNNLDAATTGDVMDSSESTRGGGAPSVRARTAENVAIIIAIQWVSRGFAVATKIILARVLFPQDFGIFALAAGL